MKHNVAFIENLRSFHKLVIDESILPVKEFLYNSRYSDTETARKYDAMIIKWWKEKYVKR